jgi:hypothetical protein
LILIDIFFNVFLSQGFSLLFVKEEEKKKETIFIFILVLFFLDLIATRRWRHKAAASAASFSLPTKTVAHRIENDIDW